MLSGLIQLQMEKNEEHGYEDWFEIPFETSELLFKVLDKANSWSLEEVLLGSMLDDDDVILCHRKLQDISTRWQDMARHA